MTQLHNHETILTHLTVFEREKICVSMQVVISNKYGYTNLLL